jgi:hypothetical protein
MLLLPQSCLMSLVKLYEYEAIADITQCLFDLMCDDSVYRIEQQSQSVLGVFWMGVRLH